MGWLKEWLDDLLKPLKEAPLITSSEPIVRPVKERNPLDAIYPPGSLKLKPKTLPILSPFAAHAFLQEKDLTFLDARVSQNFLWKEAFKGCSEAEILACIHLTDIAKQAELMEQVRAFLGNHVITVNSWYRDKAHNAKVGGASKSQHILGRATDFTVKGLGVWHCIDELNHAPFMQRRGLEMMPGMTWIHVDSRSLQDGNLYGWRFKR